MEENLEGNERKSYEVLSFTKEHLLFYFRKDPKMIKKIEKLSDLELKMIAKMCKADLEADYWERFLKRNTENYLNEIDKKQG